MLLYRSLEAAHKEDKANSKADESVVLVGLATWPPTRAPVIKALLEKEVAKSADSSKAVIFIPHIESSSA
jgi:hypothetical protein